MRLFILLIVKTLFIILPLLISVAFFTIAERKIMGSIQIRKGPNVVGYIGLLQPLADGLKLFIKESVFPNSSNELIFLIAPLMALILSIMGWSVIPFSKGLFLSDLNLGIIYLFCISGFNVYSLLFAGWGSNSKYAFLGAVRSTAQMISYEISLSFLSLIIIISVNSYNLSNIILSQEHIWFILPYFPLFIIFYICILAETNRHPFDLPEAESELVSGYNIEYSGMSFALFFLAEYGNMLLMSILGSILFFGGWFISKLICIFPDSLLLGLKICMGVIYFIINRSILPRFRFDQLMELGWIFFLPLILGYLFLFLTIFINLNGLPN